MYSKPTQGICTVEFAKCITPSRLFGYLILGFLQPQLSQSAASAIQKTNLKKSESAAYHPIAVE